MLEKIGLVLDSAEQQTVGHAFSSIQHRMHGMGLGTSAHLMAGKEFAEEECDSWIVVCPALVPVGALPHTEDRLKLYS